MGFLAAETFPTLEVAMAWTTGRASYVEASQALRESQRRAREAKLTPHEWLAVSAVWALLAGYSRTEDKPPGSNWRR